MHVSGLDLFFWAFTFLLHCVLLGVLLLRQRARRFPLFTSLIGLSVVRTIILYFTYRHGSADVYFYTFWSLGFLDMALQFGVAYELASQVFRPLGAWAPDVRRSFCLLGAASLLLAVTLTWLAAPAMRLLRQTIEERGSLFSAALMSELFVIMVALSVTMGLPWRTHVARISQGFGVYSIFCILVETGHTYFGTLRNTYTQLTEIRISLYCACVLYWIFTLARDEPEPRQLPEQVRLELRDLQRRASMVLESFRQTGRA